MDELERFHKALRRTPSEEVLHIRKTDWSPAWDELDAFVLETIRLVNETCERHLHTGYILESYSAQDRTGNSIGYCEGGGPAQHLSSCVHTLEWELVSLLEVPPTSYPIRLELQLARVPYELPPTGQN